MADSKRSIIPYSYRLQSAMITNYEGREIDILNLVHDFTITESVYSMFAIYEFNIVDAVVLLEKYAITGNEKLNIVIVKSDTPESEEQIEKKLVVAQISRYAKPAGDSQAYTLKCISETAMISAARRVSRGVSGNIGKIIQDLYNEVQYNLPLNSIDANDEGNYNIVLPNETFSDTFSMLLSRAQRSNGSVFYFYETLFHGQVLTSYDEMISRPSVEEYKYMSGESTAHQTPENFEENRKRIISISSKLGASHFEGFKSGAFNSRVHSVDISTKQYQFIDYSLATDGKSLPKIDKDHLLFEGYEVAGKPLADIKESATFNVAVNSQAFDGPDNISNKKSLSLPKRKSVIENQYALNHKISVTADTRLRAGECIDIKLPQATDPEIVSEHMDDMMSGKYYIATVVHKLDSKGIYTQDLQIKKDSINRDKIKGKYDDLGGS